jgi:hypothetical protein
MKDNGIVSKLVAPGKYPRFSTPAGAKVVFLKRVGKVLTWFS